MRNRQSLRVLVSAVVVASLTAVGCNVTVDDPSLNQPIQSHPDARGFLPPVRIKAGGEFVAVESPGYACPTMADVDGDGLKDLVVGQFSNGHMQFCKNIATTGPPAFATPEWIMTGDERAVVPGVW